METNETDITLVRALTSAPALSQCIHTAVICQRTDCRRAYLLFKAHFSATKSLPHFKK